MRVHSSYTLRTNRLLIEHADGVPKIMYPLCSTSTNTDANNRDYRKYEYNSYRNTATMVLTITFITIHKRKIKCKLYITQKRTRLQLLRQYSTFLQLQPVTLTRSTTAASILLEPLHVCNYNVSLYVSGDRTPKKQYRTVYSKVYTEYI